MKKAPAYKIVKVLRQNKGFSQKDLAAKVGMTQQAIALIENGKRKLEFELFIDILNSLGTTQEELHEIINEVYNPTLLETLKPDKTLHRARGTPSGIAHTQMAVSAKLRLPKSI